MTLIIIEGEVHAKIGILRSILRYIQTPEFKEFYDQYHDQEYLQQLIGQGNKEQLRMLLKEHIHGPLYAKSLRDLRIHARDKGIANWFWMTKPTLIRLLS